MTPIAVAHPMGARACYKHGVSVGVSVRVHSRCGQVQFPASSLCGAQDLWSLRTTSYTRGIGEADPPVRRLFDPSGEELARTPKPSVSPRDTLHAETISGHHMLPGMATSTSAAMLFARSRNNLEEVQSHKTHEEQKNGHEYHEDEKGEVDEEIGQGVDAEEQASIEACADQEEGTELATLRDNVAEIEQRLCMVQQQLGEDAALPFFGPLSVLQRGLSALEIWQHLEAQPDWRVY